MYLAVLAIHSLVRWAVLVFALAALVPSWIGWLRGTSRERRRLGGKLLVAILDVQLLFGLVLYFALSPVTHDALAHPSQIAGGPAWSYWTVAHPLMGLTTVVLAHLGQALSRRAPDARSADRRSALLFGAAFLAAVAATPWPFLPVGRSLWPF